MMTSALYRYERAHNQAIRAFLTVMQLDCEEPDEHPAYWVFLRWDALADDIYNRLSPDDRVIAQSLVD